MKNIKYEKIQLVAANLINQKGYRGSSLQQIANKVGLHKSSLFHYFKSKEELLLQIVKEPVEQVNENLEKIISNNKLKPEVKLKKAIENHLILLIENRNSVNIYLNELRSLSKRNQIIYLKKRKKYEQDFGKIIVEMKKNGYFRGLDEKIITYGVLGMLNGVGKWYKKDDGPLTVKQVSSIFYRLIKKRQ